MKDDDLERLLQRYEPAAPPASLRARAIGARTEAKPAWPWAVAAAALLAMTVWLHGARTLLPTPAGADTPSSYGEEALLADMLGGTDDARAMARTIVALDDASQREASAVGTTGTTGDER